MFVNIMLRKWMRNYFFSLVLAAFWSMSCTTSVPLLSISSVYQSNVTILMKQDLSLWIINIFFNLFLFHIQHFFKKSTRIISYLNTLIDFLSVNSQNQTSLQNFDACNSSNALAAKISAGQVEMGWCLAIHFYLRKED